MSNLPDSQIVARFPHPDGDIALTHADASHVLERHFSDEELGSRFVETWSAVLNEISHNLPERLEYGEAEDIHIEIECDRVIGFTGIARRVDLFNTGMIDADTFRVLDEAEPEIFVRNLMDTEAEKQQFVEDFNSRYHSDQCELTVRGNSICVLVESDLAETQSFVAILNPFDHTEASHRLATMFPGPDMPRLPGDPYFKGTEAGWNSTELRAIPANEQRALQVRQLSANRSWAEYAFLQPNSK